MIAKTRIKYIDAARGIAIVSVVAGHSLPQAGLPALLLYSFHLPLFFLLSGFTSSWNETFSAYLRKRAHSLLVPYAATLMAAYLYWLCFYRYYAHDPNSPLTIAAILLKTGLYGVGNSALALPGAVSCGPIWFLPALFCANLLFFLVVRKSDVGLSPRIFPLVVALGIAGFLIGQFIWLPASFDIAMVAQVYLLAGFLLRRGRWLETSPSLATAISVVAIWVMYMYSNSIGMNPGYYRDISMNDRPSYDIGITYAGSLCGGVIVLWLSKALGRFARIENIFVYLGQAAIVILCFHTWDIAFGHFTLIAPRLYGWLQNHWPVLVLWRLGFSLFLYEICRRVSVLAWLFLGKSNRMPTPVSP